MILPQASKNAPAYNAPIPVVPNSIDVAMDIPKLASKSILPLK